MLSNSKTIFKKITDNITNIYDQDEARSIAFIILEEIAGVSKTEILTGKEINISKSTEEEITELLERLQQHEPLQYILGKAHFYGLEFVVDKHVLIPRQETEELVAWIIQGQHESKEILDIGTGCGCIAIALAKRFPATHVTAWDISETALTVARSNATTNHAEVEFQQIDIFSDIPSCSFDLIVSNPPYVPVKEKENMSSNVLAYEPGKALFVPDHDPLIFYETICRLTKEILRPGGWLYYEINESFGEEVIHIMEIYAFEDIELKKDLNGKARMVRGRKPIIFKD